MRRSPGWFKLLALEEQVRLRAYEWLLWMDADTLIMDPVNPNPNPNPNPNSNPDPNPNPNPNR